MKHRVACTVFLFVGIAGVARLHSASSHQAVELRRSGETIEILVGGQLFTTYHFEAAVAKPYFQPLRSAKGTVVTRDFPILNTIPPEHLHDDSLEPHQRPMYFGHGNIDGVDFWGEAAFPNHSSDSVFGRAVLRKIDDMEGGPDHGVLRASFNLVEPGGRVIAEEDQSYSIHGDENSRVIDCEFTLIASGGSDLVIGDTKEGTFGLRLAPELNAPPGHIVNSEGAQDRKAWGQRADWVDYYGTVGGEAVGVAILDSPKSFRHPTYWHARPYGLAAANPFGIREFTNDPKQDGSWTVPQKKSLTFRYRVIIHHGDTSEAGIAAAYQQYAAEQK
jgi:Family of unknown function (DUF6807)